MLINIQVLRFAAAALVVLYHTAGHMPALDHPLLALFAFGSNAGFAGVDVFFVISGFIMAYTTNGKIGPADSMDFARRRVARIYSGYWPFFFLALAVFWWARNEHIVQAKWLASFFLWPQPLNLNVLEISWTLSFEMYFYALFTLIVWFLPPPRRGPACALVLIAMLTFNAWRHFVKDGFAPENLYQIAFWDIFLSSPFIVEFFAGAVAAYWLANRREGPAWTWLAAGAGLYVVAGAINKWAYGGLIEQGYHLVPRVALFGTAAVMMLTGLVRLEYRGRKAPVQFSLVAGGATYAIYLAHVPILVLLHWLGLGSWAGQQAVWVMWLVYLSLTLGILAASAIYYRTVERRLHRGFRRALGVGD